MNFKKSTPRSIKKLYHRLKFYFESCFMLFYKVKPINKLKKPGSFSQYGQDIILKNIFINIDYSINGAIVEIGSNEPIRDNNTYYFYENHQTVSIDPIDYTRAYKDIRPKTVFVNCAVSNYTGLAKYYKVLNEKGWEDKMSGFEKPEGHYKYEIITVPVKTLNNILAENNIKKIGLLFLDCEGHELTILNSLDWESFSPDICIIENKLFGFEVRRLLKSKGFDYKYRIYTADDVFVKNSLLKSN
jgi:FkbM family methyltransferase